MRIGITFKPSPFSCSKKSVLHKYLHLQMWLLFVFFLVHSSTQSSLRRDWTQSRHQTCFSFDSRLKLSRKDTNNVCKLGKSIQLQRYFLSLTFSSLLSLFLSLTAYTNPDFSYGTRNINYKFRTIKTPELRYDPRLLIHKGVRNYIHN